MTKEISNYSIGPEISSLAIKLITGFPNFCELMTIRSSSSSSSSLKFLEWPKQQRHHEDHYSQSKYEQYQTVL